MSSLLIKRSEKFGEGYTAITKIDEKENNTGIELGILKLRAGEKYEANSPLECAYLLLQGRVTFHYNQTQRDAERHSLFDQSPIALHLAANQAITIVAHTDAEFALSQVKNNNHFETMVFDDKNMAEPDEQRGIGLLDNTSHRIVRTIFDTRNRPTSNLVLGEVINFPGRWSSYPPHHHPQPEIYHYRFTEPMGFGFAQTGDQSGKKEVVTVNQYDTLKVLYNLVHAQVAAPGYGMYYLWVVRNLEGKPYSVPTFEKDHAWTKEEGANQRVWSKK